MLAVVENLGKVRDFFFVPHFPGVRIFGQGHNQNQRQDSRQQRYTERTYGNRYIPCHSKVLPFLKAYLHVANANQLASARIQSCPVPASYQESESLERAFSGTT
jgi:hypothetical protein